MKKTIFALTITMLIAGTMISNCQNLAKKEKPSQCKEEAACQNLNKAAQDSIQQFKKAYGEKIKNYDKKIAEFKLKIAKEKNVDKTKYNKKLAELEQQSKSLKKKLSEYKDEKSDKWLSFKSDFNHNMDDLGKAVKDLTDQNFGK